MVRPRVGTRSWACAPSNRESGIRERKGNAEVEALAAAISIILINLVLSGDNAVVIGMAAHRLPQRQRRAAILFGSGAAIVLRVALTAVATFLLKLAWIRLVGGSMLLWIGF